MHSVLSIVELLNNIFAFADKQSNANNACVCKQWSKICLVTLWRDVDDLSRLFRILSPLQKKNAADIAAWKICAYFVRVVTLTSMLTRSPLHRSSQHTPSETTGRDLKLIASLFAEFLLTASNLSNSTRYWMLLGGTDQGRTSFLIYTLWNCWAHLRGPALPSIP